MSRWFSTYLIVAFKCISVCPHCWPLKCTHCTGSHCDKKYILYDNLGDNPYKVDDLQIKQRASLLQRYLCDEEKALQALYALQALMVHMEQPASKFFFFFFPLWFCSKKPLLEGPDSKCCQLGYSGVVQKKKMVHCI